MESRESWREVGKSAGFELLAATLHASSKQLDATFVAPCLPLPAEYAMLRDSLRAALPGVDVNVAIKLKAASEIFATDAERVLRAWEQLNPVLKLPLRASKLSLADGVITLRAPGGAMRALELAGTGEIEEYIQGIVDEPVSLKLVTDETLPSAVLEPVRAKTEEEPPAAPECAEEKTRAKKPRKAPDKQTVLFGSAKSKYAVVAMETLSETSGRVCVRGRLVSFESKEVRGGQKQIVTFVVCDDTNTLAVKLFAPSDTARKLMATLNKVLENEDGLTVLGECMPDRYTRELCIMATDVIVSPISKRLDTAEQKRVELHLHTQMSAMDALTDIGALFRTAKRWGHSALAVTDHGVVQAFPDAYKAAKKTGVKLIYGLEGYLLDDCEPIPVDTEFVAIALETAGKGDAGLVRLRAQIVNGGGASFETLVNPGHELTERQEKKLGLTNAQLKAAPEMADALNQLCDFAAGRVFAVCEARDMELLWTLASRYGVALEQGYVDVKQLAQCILHELKAFEMQTVANALGVTGLAQILGALIERQRAQGITTMGAVSKRIHAELANKPGTYHIILLAQNARGLKNLYKLVSFSHIRHFYRRPRLPRSLLLACREGLLVGSACEAGELFSAVVAGEPNERLAAIAGFYDYLEIQPIDNNAFMLRNGTAENEAKLREFNTTVFELGNQLGRPVVATGDVHFLNPQDSVYRGIVMDFQNYTDADMQAPLYFKTTDEMLEEFAYLGDAAHEVVVENPARIAQSCDEMPPFPDATFAPKIAGSDETLERIAMEGAREIYGDELPEIVSARLNKELGAIIKHGFSVLYFAAHKLVAKSLADGYIVGSRGSVGSSLVATMAGITEVNPLPPHYVCEQCKYSNFEIEREKYACGFDMPPALCPSCGAKLRKDGFDIPFEVFLGFRGEKVPDIDLNFSGEYQALAHKYTEELFGGDFVFRAGTISAIKDKTAVGMVLKYHEKRNSVATSAQVNRLAAGISGVKRTTGQHPGGIVVLPRDEEIFTFTPIQYPADDRESGIITTHFDFNSMHDTLVKLDILGHDDPTSLRMLETLTGVSPTDIPLDDAETMSLFSSAKALGIEPKTLGSEVGTYGIPEFGTGFVRQMLTETRPTTMEELVRIAGLSHGTDVWLGNAQELIKSKSATLSEVICTRDDIMNYLIQKGLDSGMAFEIMENVRKGKGLTPQMELAMTGIPEWFTRSCKKIKYMFPRAHAAAYVMMAFRIAYFKVHRPIAFYATYFTVRSDVFDIGRTSGGPQRVKKEIAEIERLGYAATNRDKELLTVLEVVLEMNLRGIELLPIDIYKSAATEFCIEGGAIRPPLSALPGLGESVAGSIASARQQGEFISVEDLKMRTKASSAIITALEEAGALRGLPATNQISLF